MFDKKEIEILSILRKNARSSIADISRQTKIPISTVFDKIKKIEKRYVKKHTVIFDHSKTNFFIRVNLIIKNCSLINDLEKMLMDSRNVNSLYRINNNDFLVEGFFKDMKSLHLFSTAIQGFGVEKEEHFVIEELKKEEFLVW